MSQRSTLAIIAALAMATSGFSATPELSPEQTRQIERQQQAYRAWLATLPPPEAYLRPADQERARMISKPCTPADLGHGCHHAFSEGSGIDALTREMPCANETPDFVAFLPLDECYRMTPSQPFEGVWIDAFEGSRFYPGLTYDPDKPPIDTKSPDVREHVEPQGRADIWLDVQRVNFPHAYAHGGRDGRAVLLKFIGRQTLYPGHYGHMGMSKHQIIVDKLIEARELK